MDPSYFPVEIAQILLDALYNKTLRELDDMCNAVRKDPTMSDHDVTVVLGFMDLLVDLNNETPDRVVTLEERLAVYREWVYDMIHDAYNDLPQHLQQDSRVLEIVNVLPSVPGMSMDQLIRTAYPAAALEHLAYW
jgi:hypothetical protein